MAIFHLHYRNFLLRERIFPIFPQISLTVQIFTRTRVFMKCEWKYLNRNFWRNVSVEKCYSNYHLESLEQNWKENKKKKKKRKENVFQNSIQNFDWNSIYHRTVDFRPLNYTRNTLSLLLKIDTFIINVQRSKFPSLFCLLGRCDRSPRGKAFHEARLEERVGRTGHLDLGGHVLPPSPRHDVS